MTIELKPGRQVLVGHEPIDLTHEVTYAAIQTSESVTVTAVEAPVRFARSIPASTTVVNWLLARPTLLHEGDAIGLLTGGGPTSVANPGWVNDQAKRLRAVFPEVTIFAQVSGTKDVDTVARQCKANINAVALVQESGFGIESEPWNPTQASTEARITKAKKLANDQGVDLILHMSGKGVPWRQDDIPTWDYSRFAAIVGDTFPNVIQTQRDYQSDWEGTNDRVTQAHGLVKAQIPSWLPQVTLDPSEVNGITHNKGGDPAFAFLSELAEAEKVHGRGRGISLWSLDTTALGAVLAETREWVV
jgi:hypothetical protein